MTSFSPPDPADEPTGEDWQAQLNAYLDRIEEIRPVMFVPPGEGGKIRAQLARINGLFLMPRVVETRFVEPGTAIMYNPQPIKFP